MVKKFQLSSRSNYTTLIYASAVFHFDLPPKLRLDSLFDSAYEIIEAPQII